MARQYVTGAAHIFVGVGAGYSPVYLGTAERYPKIVLRPNYKPTFADQGGEVPFDMSFQGEEGFVFADISRWNEATYAALAARPRPNGIRGSNAPGDVGTLLQAEGMTYPLWVYFPYFSKPAFAGMPAGYRFLSSYVAGPDELEPLGTTPRKIRLTWHCLRAYRIIQGRESFYLYDHNMSQLNASLIN